MPKRTVEMTNQNELRRQAETRISGGTARSMVGRAAGVEALASLHTLAGSPASAGDALKLLHELQVHQVELDLQNEELERGLSDLSGALDLTTKLYDLAPVGLLTVDLSGAITEANLRCADMLRIDRTTLIGRRVDGLMTEESRPVLMAVLKRISDGGSRESCLVQADGSPTASKRLQVVACAHPDGQYQLLALIDVAEGNL